MLQPEMYTLCTYIVEHAKKTKEKEARKQSQGKLSHCCRQIRRSCPNAAGRHVQDLYIARITWAKQGLLSCCCRQTRRSCPNAAGRHVQDLYVARITWAARTKNLSNFEGNCSVAAGKPGEAGPDAGQHQRHVPHVLQTQQAA